MNVAFFHGLESEHISDKSEYLISNFDFAYCPKMIYSDKRIYQKTLNLSYDKQQSYRRF